MEHLEERELVEQFCSSDEAIREAAFEEIYRRLGAGLQQVCRRMIGNAADTEDALQETILGIYRGLPTFRAAAQLSTWAYRIAVRTCLHSRRKRRRNSSEDLAESLPAKRDDSSEEARLAQRLDRAVAALRPAYRTVFSLCCIDDLNQADVARILGIPEGTVWTRLHRARKELAASLRDVL